ncbi:hypothetical protein [Aquipseudomonas alcaligenes]|nr:hypothetical protein [Pseudomonas alcaligenes]
MLVSLFLLASSSAFAAGGTGEYELDWPVQGETLAYRSCGCGDACWVAEVRERASQQVRASLSCDCSDLAYAEGEGERQALGESCAVLNGSADKAASIAERLRQLQAR